MALCYVHGLREADVGADCGAEEVEGPEGGDDAPVEFSVDVVDGGGGGFGVVGGGGGVMLGVGLRVGFGEFGVWVHCR